MLIERNMKRAQMKINIPMNSSHLSFHYAAWLFKAYIYTTINLRHHLQIQKISWQRPLNGEFYEFISLYSCLILIYIDWNGLTRCSLFLFRLLTSAQNNKIKRHVRHGLRGPVLTVLHSQSNSPSPLGLDPWLSRIRIFMRESLTADMRIVRARAIDVIMHLQTLQTMLKRRTQSGLSGHLSRYTIDHVKRVPSLL